MKSNAARSRPQPRAGRKSPQTAPLTQLMVTDALHTWVIPTVAGAAAFVMFVLYNVGLVEDASAITTIGVLALLTVLFFGLRGFIEQAPEGTALPLVIAFAVVWAVAGIYPFYRTVNPGTPVFATQLSPHGAPVTVPLQGQPGRYSLVLEGHFLPSDARSNRTATYSLTLGHQGATDRVVQGTFSQTWGQQRIGAGRRSSLVPTMHEVTRTRETIDDPEGRDLTLQLTELSAGVRDTVAARLYAETVPQWALMALGFVALVGAVVVDARRPKSKSDGLMTTLTVATFIAVVIFRVSSPVMPGFPQLAVAALMGTLVGALGGSLVWRLAQPLRRYLAAR